MFSDYELFKPIILPSTDKSSGNLVIGVQLKIRSPSTVSPLGNLLIGVLSKTRFPLTVRPSGNLMFSMTVNQ